MDCSCKSSGGFPPGGTSSSGLAEPKGGTFPWSYRGQAVVIGLQPFDEWLQSFSLSLAFESLCDLTRTAATDGRDQWQLFLATLCE